MELEASKIEEWSASLFDERLLLLACVDEDVLDSALRRIQAEPSFRDQQWRALYFTPENADTEFWRLLPPGFAYPSDTVIVVYALDRGTDRFLQSIPDALHLLDYARERLGEQCTRLLILTTDQSFSAAGRTPIKAHRMSQDIDFLRPLLLRELPSTFEKVEGTYLQYQESLVEGSVQEFRRRVHTRLTSDAFKRERTNLRSESLRANLVRDLFDKIYRTIVALGSTESLGVGRLIDDEQPLRNSVLFVAAFFESLSLEDFQRTLETLLRGQTTTVPIPLSAPLPSGGALPVPLMETRALSQLWKDRRQKLMSECCLQSGPKRTVEFAEIEGTPLRQEVQRAFTVQFPFLHDEFFQRVASSGLLFDVSDEVSEGARNLVADRAARDSLYGNGCVVESILNAAGSFQADVLPGSDLAKSLSQLLASLPNARRDLVYRRLRELLANLLDRGLDQITDGAITRLMDLGLHQEALNLIRLLWNHRQFGGLRVSLIKRSFDQADKKTRDIAYRHVCDSVGRGEGDIAGMLTGMCAWLPPNNGLASSPSSRMALKLLIDLSEDALTNEKSQSLNPLAAGLAAATATDAFAGIAADWLFRPELEEILKSRAAELWEGEAIAEEFDLSLLSEYDPLIHHNYLSRLIYGWILPRGFSATPDSEFYIEVFFGARSQYEDYLPEDSRYSLGPAFRTLVLADCVLALAPPGSEPKPVRMERLNRLMEEVGRRMDSQHRRHMPAHWHALAETMLERTAVLPGAIYRNGVDS